MVSQRLSRRNTRGCRQTSLAVLKLKVLVSCSSSFVDRSVWWFNTTVPKKFAICKVRGEFSFYLRICWRHVIVGVKISGFFFLSVNVVARATEEVKPFWPIAIMFGNQIYKLFRRRWPAVGLEFFIIVAPFFSELLLTYGIKGLYCHPGVFETWP